MISKFCFWSVLLVISVNTTILAQNESTYNNNLAISTWISLENPITGIKYQNNSSALGYFVNVKSDFDKFMATAGPSFTVIKEHNLYFGAGTFDGFLALELGISIQRRKLSFDLGIDYVPEDRFNFLVPTIGIGINF